MRSRSATAVFVLLLTALGACGPREEAQPAPDLGARLHRSRVQAVDVDGPVRPPQRGGQAAQQCGLAGPVRTQEPGDAPVQRDRDARGDGPTGDEVAPAVVRVPEATAWIGQRVPFFVELSARGSFAGTASFDLPQIPGTSPTSSALGPNRLGPRATQVKYTPARGASGRVRLSSESIRRMSDSALCTSPAPYRTMPSCGQSSQSWRSPNSFPSL